MENALLVPFERRLESLAVPAAVRAVEGGGGYDAMWNGITASGFLDALVAEDHGGAGLPLSAVQPLWQALGRFAVPLPVGETMIARALLAGSAPVPEGPIALAVAGAAPRAIAVPCGLVAAHLLVESNGILSLYDAAKARRQATGVAASLAAHVELEGGTAAASRPAPRCGLRAIAAVLRAALIAGAADRLVEMTALYANERIQFGKPIGRQQALQQNMAVMAEEAVAARIASQLGCAGDLEPSLVAAATAKSVASKAAGRVAATAHAVHGAIGISEEYDLQLYTRRLHEWRLADGSEGFWNRELGAVRLASADTSVDFVRAQFAAVKVSRA